MARTAAAYCELEDARAHLGDQEIGNYTSLETWILKTADEMDALLGQYYLLPITFNSGVPSQLADKLLLCKINEMLAAGRCILSMSQSGELNNVHAYGNQLISDATKELARIAAGRTVLEGATPVPSDDQKQSGPMISNRDAYSYVDAFYRSNGTAHLPMIPKVITP